MFHFHFCEQELQAIQALFPFAQDYFQRIYNYIKKFKLMHLKQNNICDKMQHTEKTEKT